MHFLPGFGGGIPQGTATAAVTGTATAMGGVPLKTR
jgi:hypothetical protein